MPDEPWELRPMPWRMRPHARAGPGRNNLTALGSVRRFIAQLLGVSVLFDASSYSMAGPTPLSAGRLASLVDSQHLRPGPGRPIASAPEALIRLTATSQGRRSWLLTSRRPCRPPP